MATLSSINRSAVRPPQMRPLATRQGSPVSEQSDVQAPLDPTEAQVDQQVKSGQHMMTGGEVGAGVSLAAGVGLAFAVNPLLGFGVGALGLFGSAAAFFLGICKITAATD